MSLAAELAVEREANRAAWAKWIDDAGSNEAAAERPMTSDEWQQLSSLALAELANTNSLIRPQAAGRLAKLALKCSLRAEAARQGRVMP